MKKYIIISPYSKKLPNGNLCAKDYPYWKELVHLLKSNHDVFISQAGVKGESLVFGVDECLHGMELWELQIKLEKCDFWISVDNFFHHFAALHSVRGAAIFSKSNPEIFGHPQNLNVFKDKSYFRPNQFDYWSNEPYDKESFLDPLELYKIIKREFL